MKVWGIVCCERKESRKNKIEERDGKKGEEETRRRKNRRVKEEKSRGIEMGEKDGGGGEKLGRRIVFSNSSCNTIVALLNTFTSPFVFSFIF